MSLLFLFLILPISIVLAHTGEDFDFSPKTAYPLTLMQAAGYGSIIFGALIFIVIFKGNSLSDSSKKTIFISIAGLVSLITLYLVVVTLHMNLTSDTKGPVHWHADYEIWACGKRIRLAEPKFMSNTQGTQMTHSHNDDRIHIEGTLLDLKESGLRYFFHSVGGSISIDGMSIPTDEGMKEFHNGDLCNELPARLYAFVNGNQVADFPAYRISHYGEVPPGDRIKFVFTEKPLNQIGTNIGKNGT